MTTHEYLREILRQRRAYPKGSPDWNYRTRAARKYVWIMRGVPPCEWEKMT